uniref:Uncharacterized protein n=1 Tax=Peronospora matthiolae TaxID=2874970 RepID=A0AAV1URB6_9STRA
MGCFGRGCFGSQVLMLGSFAMYAIDIIWMLPHLSCSQKECRFSSELEPGNASLCRTASIVLRAIVFVVPGFRDGRCLIRAQHAYGTNQNMLVPCSPLRFALSLRHPFRWMRKTVTRKDVAPSLCDSVDLQDRLCRQGMTG